jgi:hypothetical protein
MALCPIDKAGTVPSFIRLAKESLGYLKSNGSGEGDEGALRSCRRLTFL